MAEWHRVASAEEVELETPFPTRVGDQQICVMRLPDGLFAINDICTHEYAMLSDGYYEDGKLECPLHQACFEVRTGKALNEPAEIDVQTYPVKEEGGAIFVQV